MSSGRIVPTDAQPFLADAEYVKKGVEFGSLTGVATTRLGNGDIFYAVDTTAASRTVTLPDVADEVGRHHIVKRLTGGANQCNIVPAEGTAILDGSATHSIGIQYGVRGYFSDGEVWQSTVQAVISAFGQTLVDDANAAAARTTLGLVIGTDVQAQNADLQKIASATAWVNFSPTISAQTGVLGSATVNTARAAQYGKLVFFSLDITIASVGTGSNGLVVSNLPVTSRNVAGFGGVEVAIVGYGISGQINGASTQMTIRKYDGSNLIVLNHRFVINGSYEAA